MRLALLAAFVIACGGETGTIELVLTTAPNSTLLTSVQRLRVTITQPRQVVEAERVDGAFDITLDVEAFGGAGSLIVEGFDAADVLIATGSSPPFPVAAIDARIVVYMAPPMSIGLAPEQLPVARTGVATTAISYGIVIAGGADVLTSLETDAIFIYNSYDHTLLSGLPLPAPRSDAALATGGNDSIYIIGGLDRDDIPTGTVFRFDTTVAPSGEYTELPAHPELARAGAIALPLGVERHIISGTPAVEMTFGMLEVRTDTAPLPSIGASVISGGFTFAMFGGNPVIRFTGDDVESITASTEASATATTLAGGQIAFIGGSRDVLIIDAASNEVFVRTDVLGISRLFPAVAATARHIVVAGGIDASTGLLVPTAEILDAISLDVVATIPCTPRSGARAHAFGSDQIIIVGGNNSMDVDRIELFTPPPPPL